MDIAVGVRWAIIVFFILWFGFTCLTQVKGPIRTTIKAFDVLELLPIWSFFGARPMNSDLVLQVRDFKPTGEIGVWRIIHTNPRRRWFHLFWNPQRRVHGALLNLTRRLPPQPTPADMAKFRTTAEFCTIQALVMHLPRDSDTVARQFTFVAERQFADGTMSRFPVYLSPKTEFTSEHPALDKTCELFLITEAGRVA